MSDSSLYRYCLRKVVMYLRDGIYKPCHRNPFSALPFKLVNDLVSEAFDLHRADVLKAEEAASIREEELARIEYGGLEFAEKFRKKEISLFGPAKELQRAEILNSGPVEEMRAESLEQLLTSGKLRELKIPAILVRQQIVEVLNFLSTNCQEFEVLHLKELVSVNMVLGNSLNPEISEALENLFRNTPNLQDLHCSVSFDLRALRNCKKLRCVRLHFVPRQPLYDILAKENGLFQPHKHLEVFTISRFFIHPQSVPTNDIVVILQYCPELAYLGGIDSSEALLKLRRMGMLLSELKLRHIFWKDTGIPTRNFDAINQFIDPVLHYPPIKELVVKACSSQCISCLRYFRNLVYLDICLLCDDEGIKVFNNVLQEIGHQLKHLSVALDRPMDLSILLLSCPNLESLRIHTKQRTEFPNHAFRLPNLQHLTFVGVTDIANQFFSLLIDSNRLTELFLEENVYLSDQALHLFLERNSISKLERTRLNLTGLTAEGFREFFLNAPQLEIVERDCHLLQEYRIERLIRETNHKAIFNHYILPNSGDCFARKSAFYQCN